MIFAGSAPAGRPRDTRRQPFGARRACGGSASRAIGRSSWPGSHGTDQLPLARELMAAQAYLRATGLEIDLVLLSEEPGGYDEELRRQLLEPVRADGGPERIDQPGGVFVLKAAADDR